MNNKTKKLTALALACLTAACAFTGCGAKDDNKDDQKEPDKTALFTMESYPIMDGSTANLPLMAEVMARTCDITREQAEEVTSCTTTPTAWVRLANGEADILLVYEAADVTKKELEAIGTELEITPIGRDALVFINNKDNPVTDLSTQQLLDIYTGKITNWKEVGGNDVAIVPYQRVESSGSQSLFKKLLMKDIQPMDAPTELRPTAMGELIDELANYNNTANALGYSVYYYASYMYTQPGLQFISVDGVAPNEETIAAGSYPYVNDFFVAIRADEPADSPARQLRDWILSDDGIQALKDAGYIPAPRE